MAIGGWDWDGWISVRLISFYKYTIRGGCTTMDGIGIGMGIAGWGGMRMTYLTAWVKCYISTGACMRACIFVEMFANSIGGEDFSTATL